MTVCVLWSSYRVPKGSRVPMQSLPESSHAGGSDTESAHSGPTTWILL